MDDFSPSIGTLGQADDDILTCEVTDEALEAAAAGTARGANFGRAEDGSCTRSTMIGGC
jgi:hypothetical protein